MFPALGFTLFGLYRMQRCTIGRWLKCRGAQHVTSRRDTPER